MLVCWMYWWEEGGGRGREGMGVVYVFDVYECFTNYDRYVFFSLCTAFRPYLPFTDLEGSARFRCGTTVL